MELVWGSTINANFYQFAALLTLLFYLLILTLSFQKASWVNKKPKTDLQSNQPNFSDIRVFKK
jgi:hypothetical protein